MLYLAPALFILGTADIPENRQYDPQDPNYPSPRPPESGPFSLFDVWDGRNVVAVSDDMLVMTSLAAAEAGSKEQVFREERGRLRIANGEACTDETNPVYNAMAVPRARVCRHPSKDDGYSVRPLTDTPGSDSMVQLVDQTGTYCLGYRKSSETTERTLKKVECDQVSFETRFLSRPAMTLSTASQDPFYGASNRYYD